jgi:hypothetical protein
MVYTVYVITNDRVKETVKYNYDDSGNLISKTKESTKTANPNVFGNVTVSKAGQSTNKDAAALMSGIRWSRLLRGQIPL